MWKRGVDIICQGPCKPPVHKPRDVAEAAFVAFGACVAELNFLFGHPGVSKGNLQQGTKGRTGYMANRGGHLIAGTEGSRRELSEQLHSIWKELQVLQQILAGGIR